MYIIRHVSRERFFVDGAFEPIDWCWSEKKEEATQYATEEEATTRMNKFPRASVDGIHGIIEQVCNSE